MDLSALEVELTEALERGKHEGSGMSQFPLANAVGKMTISAAVELASNFTSVFYKGNTDIMNETETDEQK